MHQKRKSNNRFMVVDNELAENCLCSEKTKIDEDLHQCDVCHTKFILGYPLRTKYKFNGVMINYKMNNADHNILIKEKVKRAAKINAIMSVNKVDIWKKLYA